MKEIGGTKQDQEREHDRQGKERDKESINMQKQKVSAGEKVRRREEKRLWSLSAIQPSATFGHQVHLTANRVAVVAAEKNAKINKLQVRNIIQSVLERKSRVSWPDVCGKNNHD